MIIPLVNFGCDRRAITAMKQAFALAGRLGSRLLINISDLELSDAEAETMLRESVPNHGDYHLLRANSVQPNPKDDAVLFVSSTDTIAAARAEAPAGSHILLALEEDGQRSAVTAPSICLPIGNRASAAYAATFAIPFAAQIGARVIACHTTYANRGKKQQPAREHMTPASQVMFNRLKRLAAEYNVELIIELVVEDSTIHGFANKVANRYGCLLTIVAPGSSILNGAYELIAQTSNVPVLVINTASILQDEITAFYELEESDPGRAPEQTVSTEPVEIPWYRTAVYTELFAALHYLVKAVVGIVIWMMTGSLVILADAMHKASDMLQGVIVAAGMKFSRHKRPGYHFDMRGLETVTMLALGSLVLTTAISIIYKSLLSLLAQVPSLDHTVRQIVPLSAYHATRIDPRLTVPMCSFMIISVVLSLVVSRYQISVGLQTKEALLVADGQETRADAITEVGALVGIICSQVFGWEWMQGASSLFVAYFVFHAGLEIFMKGWRSLFSKSLGEDVETEIRATALAVAGIESVDHVITCSHGLSLARCSMRIRTRLPSSRHKALRNQLEHVTQVRLSEVDGIKETFLDLVIDEPEDKPMRFAFACRLDPDTRRLVVIAKLSEVTHLLVCDDVYNDTRRCEVTPHEVGTDLAAIVFAKRVSTLFFHLSPTDSVSLKDHRFDGCTVAWTHSSNPEHHLGVPLSELRA